jgi:energy-converting hydrogenase B subunit D
MTMLIIQVAILVFVAASGTAVVLTRDTTCQVIGLSFYGLILALMFVIFQAPDVALSQITIGAVALPLMFMLAIAKIHRNEEHRRAQTKRGKQAKEAA